jgi:hypothetical protein
MEYVSIKQYIESECMFIKKLVPEAIVYLHNQTNGKLCINKCIYNKNKECSVYKRFKTNNNKCSI